MGLFSRTSREERFWQWFESQSDRLFDFESDQQRVFEELTASLQRVEKGLTFEFGPVRDGRREFIVSADGIRDLFAAVMRLVSAAPTFERWDVIPFRPPKDIEMTVNHSGHRLGADDVWFTSAADQGRVGLRLFVKGLSDDNRRTLCSAAFIMLDNALGEYVVETQIGFIDWDALPDKPAEAGLRPFRSIRDVFDAHIH